MSNTADKDPFLAVAGAPQIIAEITDKLLIGNDMYKKQSDEDELHSQVTGSVMLSGILDTYPADQRWAVFYNAYSRAQDITEEIREIRGAV